jgi:hypothetical protein
VESRNRRKGRLRWRRRRGGVKSEARVRRDLSPTNVYRKVDLATSEGEE